MQALRRERVAQSALREDGERLLQPSEQFSILRAMQGGRGGNGGSSPGGTTGCQPANAKAGTGAGGGAGFRPASASFGARQRGDTVLLQVWDSGLGIRAEEQAKVFEEFYQVPNTPAVAPHQRKGLGLGLAIVKRLADLMGAPLTLRSRSGHGTVFTLELPAGTRPQPSLSALASGGVPGLTLAGRSIVVVEDEPAVRAGLEVLLQGWGARVFSFDSMADSVAWADAADRTQTRPELLIVDYRLESGRNGVEAIAALRARFGAAVPAIVVTGSTMSTLDKEAQDKDFHLLLKPVVPNKLRAMIAFKLGVKSA